MAKILWLLFLVLSMKVDGVEIGGVEPGTVTFHLTGDIKKAEQLKGFSRKILGNHKRDMFLGDFTGDVKQQFSRPFQLSDGTVIQAHSIMGGLVDTDNVFIHVPVTRGRRIMKVLGFVVNVHSTFNVSYNQVYVKGPEDKSGQYMTVQSDISDSSTIAPDDYTTGAINGTYDEKNEVATIPDYAWGFAAGTLSRNNNDDDYTWDLVPGSDPPQFTFNSIVSTPMVQVDALSPAGTIRNKFFYISGHAKPKVGGGSIFMERTRTDGFISVIKGATKYKIDEAWIEAYTKNSTTTTYYQEFPIPGHPVGADESPYIAEVRTINEIPEYSDFTVTGDIKDGDYIVQVRTEFMSEYTEIPLRIFLIKQYEDTGEIIVEELSHIFEVDPVSFFGTEELHINVGNDIVISYKDIETQIPLL